MSSNVRNKKGVYTNYNKQNVKQQCKFLKYNHLLTIKKNAI